MKGPGYAPDPDGRFGCMRIMANGERGGWCGTKHRYRDRADTHARVMNRSWGRGSRYAGEHWGVFPLTVAQGFRTTVEVE